MLLEKHLFLSSLLLSNTVLFSLSVRDIAVLHTSYSLSSNYHLSLRKRENFKIPQNSKNLQDTEEVLCCHGSTENLENTIKGNWMLPYIW